MAGRWSDDQERYWRERDRERYDDDRYDVFGLNDERERWSGGENRSWSGGGRGERVFGERDTGAEYNPRPGDANYRGGEGGYGAGGGYGGRTTYSGSGGGDRYRGEGGGRSGGEAAWQDPDYEGVSPAARRGDYDVGYRERPHMRGQGGRGGRFYGDDGRQRIWRDEQGYGEPSRRYDAEGRRFGSYEADQRWEREMRRPAGAAHGSYPGSMYSGGTGGYDYERGYGDAGRTEGRREGFEDRARDAGDFLRRTGQRISSWFSDVAGEGNSDRGYDEDRRRHESYRGARGLGPKGYKRSDERISDDVHQRLADDPWLDASNINVSVSGGEVTLSGTVDSREAKHRAERVVEDLSGVDHVQNNLRVERGGYFTSAGRGYGDSANEAGMSQTSTAQSGMASSQPVKDVTDGTAASPPAQKRN